MTNRLTIILLLVGLPIGVVAGWHALRPRDDVKSGAQADSTVASPATRASEDPPRASGAAPASRSSHIVPTPFSESRGERDGVTAQAESQPEGDGIDIAVVLAPDDRPAPGAIVNVTKIPYFGFQRQLEGNVDPQQNDERPRPGELVANSAGIVRVPALTTILLLRGRLGESRGSLMISSDAQDAKLRLAQPYKVIVTNAEGKTLAHVPVALVAKGSAWGDRVKDHAVTGEDGVAQLAPLLSHPAVRPDLEQGKLTAALALLLDEPVEAPVAAGAEPTRLVMPATTKLVVRARNSDATPFRGAARVVVGSKNDDPRGIGAFATSVTTTTLVEGSAVFPYVGLSKALYATVTPTDRDLRSATAEVPAPRVAGQALEVSIPLGGHAIVVTGRLVDSAGTPSADASVSVWLQGLAHSTTTPIGMPSHTAHLKSGDDGRFEARFDRDASELTSNVVVLKVNLPRDSEESGGLGRVRIIPTQSFEVTAPASIREGRADLGDVAIPELPLLVAGRVTSSSGKRPAGVEMEIHEKRGEEWQLAYQWKTFSKISADGEFEVRGQLSLEREERGESLGVIARSKGWISQEPIPFERGAKNVSVVMVRAGRLEGSVTGAAAKADSFSNPPVEIYWIKSADLLKPRSWRSNWGLERMHVIESKFSTEGLLPGSYAVEILSAGDRKQLQLIEGIEIEGGKLNRDPRLQGIDLDKLLRSFVVTVTDEQSRPLQGAWVGARSSKSAGGEFSLTDSDVNGRATLAVVDAAVDVVVARKGYKSATLNAISADTRVALTRVKPCAVVLSLADSIDIPTPPRAISASLVWVRDIGEDPTRVGSVTDPRYRQLDFDRARFGKDRIARLDAPEPGFYEVQLLAVTDRLSGSGGSGIDQVGGKATVRATEGGSVSITIKIDPEDLKRAFH